MNRFMLRLIVLSGFFLALVGGIFSLYQTPGLSNPLLAHAQTSCPQSGEWLGDWVSQYPTDSPVLKLAQGEEGTFTARIRNIGTTTWPSSGSETVGLFEMDEWDGSNDFGKFEYPDGLGGTYGTRVDAINSSVSPNGIADFSFRVRVPNNLAPGRYRINLGLAHGVNWIETNFSGNGDDCGTRVWYPIDVVQGGTSGEADLLPSFEGVTSSDPHIAGGTVGVESRVKNDGDANAGASYLGIWVSNTKEGDPIDSSLVKEVAVPPIVAGDRTDYFNESVSIPTGLADGEYYVTFEADYRSQVAESDENNRQYSIFNIGINQPSNDCSQFISDVTIPDNTVMQPGQTFNKVWRLKNCGDTTWGSSYRAVRTSGSFGPSSFTVPSSNPGVEVDVGTDMTAPTTAGTHEARYKIEGPNGQFGVEFYVRIVVDIPQPGNDCSQFISDVTIPDNTKMKPGQTFNKVWRLKNCGDTTWGSSYRAVRTSGSFGPSSFTIPSTAPGAEVDVGTDMTAPTTVGTHEARYKIEGPNGQFGVEFYVRIVVDTPQPGNDCSQFISDVTIPDNTVMQPGQTFNKVWRLKNCGDTTWRSSYRAVRTSGSFGPSSFTIPSTAPGAEVDVGADMTAPTTAGTHEARYKIEGPNGQFGVEFYVRIVVDNILTETWIGSHVTQTKSDGVSSGQKITYKLTVQNKGTSDWVNDPNNPDVVGIYVRKQCASTVGPLDDPSGGSRFRCSDWGANQHRVAFMNEAIVKPGEQATFNLTLCTNGIAPGKYREDFGIAHGAEWIDNPYNGDPSSKLAAWFEVPIKGAVTTPYPGNVCAAVSVQGRVTDQKTGNAIADARVSIGGQVGNTDTNGNYKLNNILPGKYQVYISAGAYEDYKGEVTIPVNSTATHDAVLKPMPLSDNFRLPYPGGQRRGCTQGNNQGPSHNNSVTKYAFDFAIGIGGDVAAASNGRVISIKENGDQHGWGKYYNQFTNFVRVRHKDSDTIYMHLNTWGVHVTENQYVKSGQVIAESGNTGFSDGPHLHFARYQKGTTTSIPVSFLDVSGGIPACGHPLEARHYHTSGNYATTSLMGQLQADTTPPTGNIAFRLTGKQTHTLWLDVFDYDSDNILMKLAPSSETLLTADWQPFSGDVTWDYNTAWVQYKDETGNISDVYSDTIDASAYHTVQASFTVSPTMCANSTIPIPVKNQTNPFCEQCGWNWDLGNGVRTVDPYPSFPDATYGEPGEYTIALTVTGLMHTSAVSKQVTVLPSPTSAFTYSIAGNTIVVEANETQATEWLWDFGDGTTATGRTATHTYADDVIDQDHFATVSLTVTGGNGCPANSYEHIELQRSNVPVTTAAIAGPGAGVVKTTYPFTVTAGPATASSPITYTWQATDQNTVSHTGALIDHVSYTWTIAGIKTITVTANNGHGEPVKTTHTISIIAEPTQPLPVTTAAIAGPGAGVVKTTYPFTVTAGPATASSPITYTWQATDQNTVSRTGALIDHVSYTWTIAGTKTITITVENGHGEPVIKTHSISIRDEQSLVQKLYLPLVTR